MKAASVNKMTKQEIEEHVKEIRRKINQPDFEKKYNRRMREIDRISKELIRSSRTHDYKDLYKRFTI